jgi:hypothetical protein
MFELSVPGTLLISRRGQVRQLRTQVRVDGPVMLPVLLTAAATHRHLVP